MKIEALAMAVAFVAGTMASPENMDATSVNAQRYTAQQLSGMSDQESQTLCKLKAHICCKFKRNLESVEDFMQVEGTEQVEDAEAAATLCKICLLKGLINCGTPRPPRPRPCGEDDDGPECRPRPRPCRAGDKRPECRPRPRPCGEDDDRPECRPRPRPCRAGDKRPECRPRPRPCGEDDDRPECRPRPRPCRHGDKRPECRPTPRPCRHGDKRPECSNGPGPYPG
ncbi:hypothetical protein HRG_004089 [Hirsutella rhossiliensis]|uniref:Uncharacterized protein n=1 Tax=Hirsutella rhossiliensis TaxID=111463 RepID=A0A9P8N1T1_9HYPO|nr:uncharacterized protein HRG_04089 [Hirsutella rhossiliensis]KAH0966073.1 hypothetical protein HRG_04089 [Hirsutella rhossiliensis]